MTSPKIFDEDAAVNGKLLAFNLSREALREVVIRAKEERDRADGHHPATAAGTFSYHWGTKALRDLLITQGDWEKKRERGIESVINHDGMMIIFQNVDCACGEADPQPISRKGEGSKDLLSAGQYDTLTLVEFDKYPTDNINQKVWYFCVSFNGDEVRAELSLPVSIKNGGFTAFSERIFIIANDDDLLTTDSSTDPIVVDDFDITMKKEN